MTFEVGDVAPGALDGQELVGPGRSTNAQLRELVNGSGLASVVAMTIFNRGLSAAAACSDSQWKAYLAEPGSERYRVLPEAQLAHALRQFAQIGVYLTAA